MANNDTKVHQGSDVNKSQGDNLEAKRRAGSEITSNGVFTKTLKDGKVEIVPTSEIYEKEPDERIEGIEVQDNTVPLAGGGKVLGSSIVDRAAREFNTSKRGDSQSKHHAQGAGGSISRGEVPDPEKEEGAYEAEEEERTAARKGTPESASEGQKDPDTVDEGFNAGDPEATLLSDLPGALEQASDENVKKAQKADSRKGAKEHYDKRLAGE